MDDFTQGKTTDGDNNYVFYWSSEFSEYYQIKVTHPFYKL